MTRATSSLAARVALAGWLGLVAWPGYSGTRQDIYQALDRLQGNWPEAGLEAWINDNPEDPTVVVGDPVTYGFRARAGGYVSMVHVDSHGTASLIFPRGSGDAQRPISDVYPQSGVLEQSPPLGKETVYVVLTEGEMAPQTFGAEPGEDFVRAADSLDLVERYAGAVSELAKSSRVGIVKFQYYVEGKPGSTEYTSRGLKRVLLSDMGVGETTDSRTAPSPARERHWPDRIAFEFDSEKLTPQGRVQLDVWGEVLADERIDHSVILVGHTDDVGNEDYNLELSRRRAAAARNYIIDSFGVDPSRIEVQWRGEIDPLVPNTDDASRAKNRRVEFVFVRK